MPAPHLVALILGLAAVAAGAEPADAPAKADLYGDSLPEGAVARLGTTRFRKAGESFHAVAFAPDGKTLAALDSTGRVSLWDAATGRLAFEENRPRQKGTNTEGGVNAVLAFAADGKTLIAGLDEDVSGRPLCVWDVEGRKEVRLLEGGEAGFYSVACSADGKTVAAATRDWKIVVWDAATGRRRWAEKPGSFAVALSPDGQTLAVGYQKIHLRDAASGKENRALEVQGDGLVAALAFSPDGKALAVEDCSVGMVLWDPVRGEKIRQWEVNFEEPQLRGPGSVSPLVFSADGKTLAVCWRRCGEVDLWDPSSGKRRRAFPNAGPACAFSPDGAQLATGRSGGVRIWDAASGLPLRPAPAGDVKALHFSDDDQTLVVADAPKIGLWDAVTGKFREEAAAGGPPLLFRDGWVMAGLGLTAREVRLGRTTGKKWSITLEDIRTELCGASPDGAVLAATVGRPGAQSLALLDSASGKELHRLGECPGGVAALAFSPDGVVAAVFAEETDLDRRIRGVDPAPVKAPEPPVCRLWDAASGKLLRTIPVSRDCEKLVFTADGRYLGITEREKPFRLVETATGKAVLERKLAVPLVGAVAFSPDGDTLASADGSHDPADQGVIRLWSLDEGKELGRFTTREQVQVRALAFSHDGGRLASGSGWDGTVLVWDAAAVVKRARPAAVRLTAKEVEGLWSDLGGADAARAFRAGRALARSPEDAPAFLAGRLSDWLGPLPTAEAKHLSRLVADLGSESFEDRERASKELDRLGAAAARALRARLKGDDLSLEARLRIQQWLVRKGEDVADEGAERQWLRATEVLERLGTPEARKLLEKLAADGGPVADQAKASIGRLAP